MGFSSHRRRARDTILGVALLYMIYVSSAVRLFSTAELAELLKKSREKNTAAGVTGILLYRDGNFMQVLEGEEKAVRATYARILRDPRHHGAFVLKEGRTEERQFPDSSMAFRDCDSPEVKALPGYSAFLDTPLTRAEFEHDHTFVQRLLLTFKQTMR
jgi:hypothetical protein